MLRNTGSGAQRLRVCFAGACAARFAAVLVALSPAGCYVTSQVYSAPKHENINLHAGDLASHGIAFLTPSAATGQEEDRQTLALIFASSLAETHPEIRVITLAQTLSAINRAGLNNDYKLMYQDYRDTGLFDRQILHRLAEAVGTRYFAQLKFGAFSQQAKGRFGMLGLSVVQTHVSSFRMFVQIWDSADGAVAWEGKEELVFAYDTASERTVTLESVASQAATELIARLP